jgi:hypothetical protein
MVAVEIYLDFSLALSLQPGIEESSQWSPGRKPASGEVGGCLDSLIEMKSFAESSSTLERGTQAGQQCSGSGPGPRMKLEM